MKILLLALFCICVFGGELDVPGYDQYDDDDDPSYHQVADSVDEDSVDDDDDYAELDSRSSDDLEDVKSEPFDKKTLIGSENQSTQNPLIGRPDGHESSPKPLIGRPDGHESPQKDLIGRPDGHESPHNDLIGRPDGHESPHNDLIGRPDGHESPHNDLIGRPDGHESPHNDLIGRPDGHESPHDDLIGRPDGHESPQNNLIGRPDGHESSVNENDEEPLVRCKRPMCSYEMQCVHGMQTDALGCPICKCLLDPCEDMFCEPGLTCHAIECADSRSCTKLLAECVPSSARTCDGPEPMCSNYCPDGYKLNSRGCMTCFCNNSPQTQQEKTDSPDSTSCGSQVCEKGQICRSGVKAFDNSELAPFCAPKPLCHSAQEMAGMMRGSSKMGMGAGLMMSPRMFVPECQADGTFNPLQCHHMKAECWCVDDRGTEISGTRTTVFVDGHKPHCLSNSTVALHMSMSFMVLDGETSSDVGQLDGVITEHVSSWLLVEKQYVKVLETKTGEDDSERSIVLVKLMVFHSSVSDLPSAADHMKRKMRLGHCNIPLEGQTLALDPNSLQIEHKFTYQTINTPAPVLSDDGEFVEQKLWYECRDFRMLRTPLIILGITLTITLMIIMLILTRRYRRQYDLVQFQHSRLENQCSESSDKSFYLKDNLQNESIVLVTADALDKPGKLPLA